MYSKLILERWIHYWGNTSTCKEIITRIILYFANGPDHPLLGDLLPTFIDCTNRRIDQFINQMLPRRIVNHKLIFKTKNIKKERRTKSACLPISIEPYLSETPSDAAELMVAATWGKLHEITSGNSLPSSLPASYPYWHTLNSWRRALTCSAHLGWSRYPN